MLNAYPQIFCTKDGRRRCNRTFGTTRYWNSEAFLAYYDKRLCKPKHNDQEIFTQLCLEIFAAGLSLVTILEKEANLRKTFDNFDPNIIVNYDAEKICELMVDDLKKWKQ